MLILGVAYRGGVKETAFSGAFPLRDALDGRGAEVLAADPLFDDDELRAPGSRRGTASPSTPPSSRPTTTQYARSAPPTCPAPRGRRRPRHARPARLRAAPVRRIGGWLGRPSGAARASASSAATASPARPSP